MFSFLWGFRFIFLFAGKQYLNIKLLQNICTGHILYDVLLYVDEMYMVQLNVTS